MNLLIRKCYDERISLRTFVIVERSERNLAIPQKHIPVAVPKVVEVIQ